MTNWPIPFHLWQGRYASTGVHEFYRLHALPVLHPNIARNVKLPNSIHMLSKLSEMCQHFQLFLVAKFLLVWMENKVCLIMIPWWMMIGIIYWYNQFIMQVKKRLIWSDSSASIESEIISEICAVQDIVRVTIKFAPPSPPPHVVPRNIFHVTTHIAV